jgi:hypothetical protein
MKQQFDAARIVFLALCAANVSFTVVSCAIVLLFRNITQALTARAPLLNVIGGIGNCLQLIGYTLSV